MRIDLYLVENNYFKSRNKAKEAIDSKSVLVNGIVCEKASTDVSANDIIEVIDVMPYVSRGGLKLEKAIIEFRLDFNDKIIVDIGASTGGFTDCSLKHNAKKVYAIDVGTNQLDAKLASDHRVVNMSQTNIKDVEGFADKIDYLVMDVSFVSIEHLLPSLERFITKDNALVCLIKPQFEVGKTFIKNGVVKDRKAHLFVLNNVSKALNSFGLGIEKLIESPILGKSGNKEFLALIKRGIDSKINFLEILK